MGLTKAIFAVSVILSFMVATMAFLIVYEEYARHYKSRKEVLKESFKAALFTFVFFIVIGLLLSIILPAYFY
ncbi:MAG: hypothetical protein WDA68_03800 [Phycisphaerae bacterium]